MRADVVCLRDPFNPGRRDRRTVGRRRKISNLAPRTMQPVIAYHNGRVILRREWHRKVRDGDVVAFVVLPQGGGGGGKNPLQLVLSIAMMAVSGPLSTSLLGAELAGTAVLGEITLGRLVGGAISMVGNALISSAFAGKPSLPSTQQTASLASPSPTYTMAAQGNLARLDAAIPVQYGRLMGFPDLAAQPYAEFAGNEQYVYQLLEIGLGYYEVESIRIEDTPISSFPEIDYEIIEPGASLTLFPSNVVTSVEVAGQLAENGVWLGPYVANAAGTSANALAVDVVCPRGLYYANDSGGLSTVSATFTIEARPIDDAGAALGAYVTLGTETVSGATNTPQRYSFRYPGLSGRYEVRLQRTTAPGGTSRYADDLNWAGLRAYLPETRTWAGQTLIALRMRASNSLSSQATRKVNIIATRKLPIWDSGAGAWAAPQVTRSPAWAMADILRADYGGGLANARIDIDQLVTLAATCAARGDTFDARFDNVLTLWEALRKVGQAVRTRPYLQGGIVHFARDEAVTVPVALFSMRNMVRGSFSVDYMMPTDETADSLNVGYFDEDVWSMRRVSAALPGSASEVPLKVDLFGVTQRDQAIREGTYLAAVNRYRRKKIQFTTEMEGFIPAYGDLIAISHDMPAWGTSGEVVAVEVIASGSAIADWTLGSGATSAADGYGPGDGTAARAITDDDPANWELIGAPVEAVTPGASVTRSLFIKKDADASRFILVRAYFYLNAGGGTPCYTDVNLRTDTGASLVSSGAGGSGSAVIESFSDDYWRVTVTAVAANANDRMILYFYPSVGTTFPLQVSTAMGAATIWAGTVTRLTLSEPVTFTSGAHYIGLRTRNGGISGPYLVTAGGTDYQVDVHGLLDDDPYVGGAEERTHFAFGPGETWRQPARVMSIKPKGLYQVEIEAINEDDSVHTADEGVTAPAAQYSQLPNLFTTPEVSGLTVRSKLGDPSIALVSWQSAPGARYYVVDVSSDGDIWSRVGEPSGNNFAVPAVYGNNTLIRVAAFGFTLGSAVQVSYAANSDYFWSGTDSNLFWSGTDTNLFWSA